MYFGGCRKSCPISAFAVSNARKAWISSYAAENSGSLHHSMASLILTAIVYGVSALKSSTAFVSAQISLLPTDCAGRGAMPLFCVYEVRKANMLALRGCSPLTEL